MTQDSHTLLVTGGAGFIGSNFIRFALANRPGARVINLDALTYCGNLENLAEIESDERYRFVHGDITDAQLVGQLVDQADAVIHFAAESHVDRSIIDSLPFVHTNVLGTQVVIDAVRRAGGKRLVHVSTDEVYGSLPLDEPDRLFSETSPVDPTSPYAASKTAADLMVLAACKTHKLDAVVTRCSNNFGPYQFPEKVIPLFVTNLLQGEPVPLYGDGLNVRDWIHVDDHCEALLAALDRGQSGEVYNIGADNEQTNLDMTHMILRLVGCGDDMIHHVTDRPSHDRRYAIDATKARDELGWTAARSAWPDALEQTVRWYTDHAEWWQRVRSGAYRDYYDRVYGNR